VGFGHALLRGTSDSAEVRQPRSLEGRVWIVADARIDARDALVATLRGAGRAVDGGDAAADVDLLLHAYAAFGERLLDHVIGDFAFAVWDAPRRRLFCARDHFGVRPFFYASAGDTFAFASDLDALRAAGDGYAELDEEAVADFLLFGAFQDATATIRRDVRRLPAASMLTLDAGGMRIRKYWEPAARRVFRCRSDDDYAAQFADVFERCVSDRLAANGVAVHLSGGLDCTSIAAAAAGIASTATPGRPRQGAVTGFTTTCTGLIDGDREAHYAQMVASALGIPLVVQALERYALFERAGEPTLSTAEPIANPNLAASFDTAALMGDANLRVLLSGQGGDAMFAGSLSYYANLLRSGRWGKLLIEAARHVHATRSLAGMGLRGALRPASAAPPWEPEFPAWIEPSFARRTAAVERWHAGWRAINGGVDAHAQLRMPWLSSQFEEHEALRMPVVVRYPFYDVRLVDFVLGVPNYVTRGKRVLRHAMRGRLPEPVRTRPKTYLAGDPIRARFARGSVRGGVPAALARVDGAFVSRPHFLSAYERYLAGEGDASTWASYHVITPLALDHWLAQQFR
jgi:asparagine synthase (glutamine-hydrolysing)